MIEQRCGDLRYLQFQHFSQFPALRHGVFTRQGGCSQEPYKSLNTSTSLKAVERDSVDHVVENRARTLQALNLANQPCVTLWQVHSADICVFTRAEEWRTDWSARTYYEQGWTIQSVHKGDALMTRERDAALALSFADCTPLLFYDPEQQIIAIAHGGWRGTARGIAAATINAMQTTFGCQPATILAGIGPSIGPCCYEVSEEVRQIFMGELAFESMPTAQEYSPLVRESAAFSTLQLPARESLRLDLRETNRRQLMMAGLLPEHIEIADICTCCNLDLFFSHRGEHGRTGRFPVILSLQSEK